MFNKMQMLAQPKNCLNIKKPYPKECRLCVENCPHGAMSEKRNITADKCTECGVCMSVCPSDGFIDIDMDNMGEYIFNSEEIILNCPLAEPQGYEISCLGMLDKDAWITLLLLAGKRVVRLLTGDCGKCADKKACAISVKVFKEIHEAWPEHPRVSIEILPVKEDHQADEDQADRKPQNSRRPINRRKLSLREQGKKKIKELFPDIMAEDEYPIPKTRIWLSEALDSEPEIKIPFLSVKVSSECTGCGVCSKICPQSAIKQIDKDEKILLVYEPFKCVQCSRCVDICSTDAMKLEYVNLSSRYIKGKILLCETKARYCSKCGKQIFHHKEPGLCMACAAKDPNLKGILY